MVQGIDMKFKFKLPEKLKVNILKISWGGKKGTKISTPVHTVINVFKKLFKKK